ncbi:MAG: Asp-tRNA(Asn)/Glu-tRNA(Gln) amidotransferase subunit GatB, partial [Saprospiraceae bacterium]|nr:Asp-tRNA(Asn)/Glu-tRNA(Gln) amidotransferase subunit GatB [Saprospiraceae bacterium]
MSWETVVGLEVHVQLNTQTKAFCNDLNVFGSDPNTNISPITLAHPGTLPRMNRKHILAAIKLGLAFGSDIQPTNYFDRKNYFYPDLPKGYQITQDERPVCIGGKVEYIMGDGSIRSIRIHHLHMEEDAGKSIHDLSSHETYLDYNRAGVPLIEIVTEPDLRSSEEVYYFIQTLQQLVRHLGISDGNMEEGSFRCDCNVSVKKISDEKLGERCEIKNLNSKRFAKAAVEYEAERQIKQLEAGNSILKTTMLYNPSSGKTFPMRDKEEVNDYRYFNDPDLP